MYCCVSLVNTASTAATNPAKRVRSPLPLMESTGPAIVPSKGEFISAGIESIKKDSKEFSQITWRQRSMKLHVNEVAFRGDLSLTQKIKELQTPMDIFCYFFTNEIVETIIREYNSHMGSVDLMDGLMGRYHVRAKTRDAMICLFYHFIDMVIVNPTCEKIKTCGAVCILCVIWLLAYLLALPLYIVNPALHDHIPPKMQEPGIRGVSFCIEDRPLNYDRFYYSIFMLCFQYLVPIVILSAAYLGIYNKLKNRISVLTVPTIATQRSDERVRRMKSTNRLLISIVVIFGLSWLPLNIFNLYADIKRPVVTNVIIVVYASCHMIGMSSACLNPLLYGWLNDNFRKEFQELLCRDKEDTNIAHNSHTTRGDQSRRMLKHNDIYKGLIY